MKKGQTVLEETTEEIETLQEVMVCNVCEASENIQEFRSEDYRIHLCESCIDDFDVDEIDSLDTAAHNNKSVEFLGLLKDMSFAVAAFNAVLGMGLLVFVNNGLPVLVGILVLAVSLLLTNVFAHYVAESYKQT